VLERSANAGSTWTTVVASPALVGTDTSYTDTGLSGGTSYVYRLSASNAAGKSAPSSNVTGVTLPAAPTLTATPVSGTAVSLTWTTSATATSYRVERSANNGATWSTVASPSGTAFTDTGVQAARNYVYRVSAVNASGAGDTSAEVNVATLLSAPTGVSTTTLSATSISLAWTAPAGATGYKIERSTDTNTWTAITQSLSGTAAYFTNTGLTAGTDYYYRITALGTGTITSPTSTIVRGTTTLAAPTGLAITGTSSSAIALSWTNVTNYTRTGFKIQRSPNGTNSWTTVTTLGATATTYTNTGLTSLTRYYYRLVAVNLAGDSAPSAVVNGTTK
jgi:titin